MSRYHHLEKPITFRGMTVKNRIFVPAMKTNFVNKDRSMNEGIIGYYEEMAKGGVGLITVEGAEVDGDHLYDESILGIYDDAQIPGFKKRWKFMPRTAMRSWAPSCPPRLTTAPMNTAAPLWADVNSCWRYARPFVKPSVRISRSPCD